MKFIRLLLLAAAVVGGSAAADLACESNNSASATYNWNDAPAWNCYSQKRVLVEGEYPGKNYPSNSYIVVLGLTTNSNIVTEHDMNVNSTLGLLGKSYVKWPVTGAADNGSGLIRVTTATNTAATGDKIYCYGFNGANPDNAYGIWTVTSIDGTRFDLQGSSYSGMSGVTSGSCEIPAALKRQGYSGGATTVGKWWIKPGVAATFRGDVIDAWPYTTARIAAANDPNNTTAMVRCGDSTNGGCNFVFAGNGPVGYKATYYTNANSRNMQAIFRGTPAQHATVTTSPATNTGRFTPYASGYAWDLYGDYVDFSYLGSGPGNVSGILPVLEPTSTFVLTHFTLSGNTGHIQFGSSSAFPGCNAAYEGCDGSRGWWNVSYGFIGAGSCSGTYGCFYNPKAPAAGTCVATGSGSPCLTFGPAIMSDPADTARLSLFVSATNPGAIVVDRSVVADPGKVAASSTTGRAGSTLQNSIVFVPSTSTGYVGNGKDMTFETVKNTYAWDGSAYATSHLWYWLPDQYFVTQTLDGVVFDQNSSYLWSDADILDGKYWSAANTPTLELKNSLSLPTVNYDGNPGTMWKTSSTMFTAGAAARYRIYNNTLFAATDAVSQDPAQGSTGFVAVLGYGYSDPVGALAEFRCNATVFSAAVASNKPSVFRAADVITSVVDSVVASGVHNNAHFNIVPRTQDYWGYTSPANYLSPNSSTVPTVYRVKTTTTPGANDQLFQSRLPQVVDMTRRIKTWAQQKYPGTTFNTDDDVFAYLKADLSRLLDIPDLVSWVKAGWALKEPSLYKACGDGTHIGASVVATPMNPVLGGPIVARGEARRPAITPEAID